MGKLFPYGSHDVISTISSLGMVLFIFINGVQMDFSLITRTGKKAWIISIIGLCVPLCVLFIPLLTLPGRLQAIQKIHGGDGIMVAMLSHSLSQFATIASLLSELQIQNSELGRLSLSSALVCDILTTIISANVIALQTSSVWTTVLRNMFLLYLLIALIPLICRPIMFWIIKHTPEGRPVKDSYIYVIISMVFVLGILSAKINQIFGLGAFILGLSVPEGPPLGSALVKKLQFFGTTFFLPIFVTTCVLKADFSMDFSSYVIVSAGLVVLVTHLVKMTAIFITALCCKIPVIDALCISLILNTKGVIEVGIYNSAYDDQVLHLTFFRFKYVFCPLLYDYPPRRKII